MLTVPVETVFMLCGLFFVAGMLAGVVFGILAVLRKAERASSASEERG